MATRSTNDPTIQTPAAIAMKKRARFVRDMREGTETIRDRANVYLPRFPAEIPEDWDKRVQLTVALDAVEIAVSAMVGMAMRGGVTLGDDVPEPLKALWESVDGAGTHGDVFSAQVLDDAITDGHAAILTDFPDVPEGARRSAADDALFRPYLVAIPLRDIMSWRAEERNGTLMLSQVVIRFAREEADGEFGTTSVDEYWRYRLTDQAQVEFQVFRSGSGGKFLPLAPPRALQGPSQIPLAIVYGGDRSNEHRSMLLSRPPLLGLAWSQLLHTQIESDRRTSEHRASIAVPTYSGLSADSLDATGSLRHGPSTALLFDLGGKGEFMESEGFGLESLRLHIQDIERRMVSQSVTMLRQEGQVPETATAHRLAENARTSKLQRARRSLEDALEASLGFEAQFLGLPEGGSVALARDFQKLLDMPTLSLLSTEVLRGNLSRETYLGFLSGALDLGITPETEVEKILRETSGDTGPVV